MGFSCGSSLAWCVGCMDEAAFLGVIESLDVVDDDMAVLFLRASRLELKVDKELGELGCEIAAEVESRLLTK